MKSQIKLKPGLLAAMLFFLLLIAACSPLPDPPPSDSDDLYELRDSIRNSMYLRISEAKQEVNRQAEMMRRRAYSEDERSAARLRAKATRMEAAFDQLDVWMDTLRHDSVMGDWFLRQQEIDIFLDQIGKDLKTIF